MNWYIIRMKEIFIAFFLPINFIHLQNNSCIWKVFTVQLIAY